MPDQAIHKVIITGTGRAGTTFLMQLLTSIRLAKSLSIHKVTRRMLRIT